MIPKLPDETRQTLLEIDQYVERMFVPRDFAFLQALRDATDAGLPKINVSATEGKLLYILARIVGARRALEIGFWVVTAPCGWPERSVPKAGS